MADFDAVPRALRSLAQTAREVIPIRAERELRRARLGLETARTKFDIEERRKTRAHRERVFGAQEKERGEAREQRAWERREKGPIFKAGRLKARREIEEHGRQEEVRNEPVTHAWVLRTMGIQDEFDLISRSPKAQKGMEESFTTKLNPKTSVYEKSEGVPLLKGEVFDRPDKFNLVDYINRDFVYQAESERDNPATTSKRKAYLTKMLESPGGKERLYRKNLEVFRSLQGAYSAIMPPGQREVLKANIKRIEGKIDALRKTKPKTVNMSKRLPDGTIHKESKIEIGGNRYNELIRTGYVRGTLTGKAAKKAEPKISEYLQAAKMVDALVSQEEGEPTVEPTEGQVKVIRLAVKRLGLTFEKVSGPIREKDKTWWFDPDTKEYWKLVPLKKVEAPLMRGLPKESVSALPPAAMLKEGTRTTFKNGQIWTLKNGVPTYVGERGVVKRKMGRQGIPEKEMREIDKFSTNIPFTPAS